jgi:hypothetical protein
MRDGKGFLCAPAAVRIDDELAGRPSAEVQAAVWTVRNDIAFARGAYRPCTTFIGP